MSDEPENEWDYDIAKRVARAIEAMGPRDGDMAALLSLRWQVRELMEVVKITDLTALEVVALLAILTPANGRRLLRSTFDEALRPVLRLVNNEPDLRDSVDQLVEHAADLPDEIAGGDSVQA
jgi:hypothetical protein